MFMYHMGEEVTYENLPEIFLITTMMITPTKPMASRTPTMIPTRVTTAKPSEWKGKEP